MAYEQRPNTGSMFKNEKHAEDPKQPNVKGSANIVCPHCSTATDYWADAWVKRRDSGEPWQSLSFKPKKAAGTPLPPQHPRPPPPPDEDYPF